MSVQPASAPGSSARDFVHSAGAADGAVARRGYRITLAQLVVLDQGARLGVVDIQARTVSSRSSSLDQGFAGHVVQAFHLGRVRRRGRCGPKRDEAAAHHALDEVASKGTSISSTWSSLTPAAFLASAWRMVQESSSRKPAPTVWLRNTFLHEVDDEVVADKCSRVHDRFPACRPRGGAGLDGCAQHVTGRVCGIPNFWQMKVACVPFPAPGAPNKISLMLFL